jgi:CBS domain-containing protein
MKARELMTTNVECVSPEATLREIAGKMKSLDVGFVPVCEGTTIHGTVTDRDIVIRALAEGRDITTTKARDIMSKDVFCAFEDDSIEQVADLMRDKEVRRMIVVDSNKRLAGVISLGDLSQAKEKLAGQTTKDITSAA